MRFLSTPSARRATAAVLVVVDEAVISIHALREEGDFMPSPLRSVFRLFLSTPSARRATFLRVWSLSIVLSNFYPRPPRGGRRERWIICADALAISIHALREEGDSKSNKQNRLGSRFLSTPSARRATRA